MTGSTYNRGSWNQIDGSAVSPFSSGVAGTASANTVTNFDFLITDDVFIHGLEFISDNATMGDLVTLEIIDITGVMAPPGTVLMTPVSNWNVLPGTNSITYDSVAPKKGLGGLYIRAIYTNSSLSNNVKVGINYNLLKILF